MRFIGFYNYTVILTYVSLASALVGLITASKGDVGGAVFFLIFSGFCDLFDGVIARTKKDRTTDQKNFGIQLDSLCDVIAFGVLPAAIYYFSGVKSMLGVVILVIYVLCGLIRLAFFNVLETKRQADPDESACLKEFRGMPITFSAIITPIIYGIGTLLGSPVAIWIYYIAPAVMAFLFVADIKVPKIDVGSMLTKKK